MFTGVLYFGIFKFRFLQENDNFVFRNHYDFPENHIHIQYWLDPTANLLKWNL